MEPNFNEMFTVVWISISSGILKVFQSISLNFFLTSTWTFFFFLKQLDIYFSQRENEFSASQSNPDIHNTSYIKLNNPPTSESNNLLFSDTLIAPTRARTAPHNK